MEKEFDLSKIIEQLVEMGELTTRERTLVEGFKDFIKRLKEEMCRCGTMVKRCYLCRNLDKLAGDKFA